MIQLVLNEHKEIEWEMGLHCSEETRMSLLSLEQEEGLAKTLRTSAWPRSVFGLPSPILTRILPSKFSENPPHPRYWYLIDPKLGSLGKWVFFQVPCLAPTFPLLGPEREWAEFTSLTERERNAWACWGDAGNSAVCWSDSPRERRRSCKHRCTSNGGGGFWKPSTVHCPGQNQNDRQKPTIRDSRASGRGGRFLFALNEVVYKRVCVDQTVHTWKLTKATRRLKWPQTTKPWAEQRKQF